MYALLRVVIKEFLQLRQDKKMIPVMIVGPVAQLLALGFGLLVSSFSDTQAMAFQVGAVSSMLPAIFLSGFIFPIRSMPAALQALTYAVPARYFLVILRGIILKGAPLTAFLGDLVFLVVYGIIVLAFAWHRLVKAGV